MNIIKIQEDKNLNYWIDEYQDYWCCTRHKENSERPGIDSVCWKYINGGFCHSSRPVVTKVLYEVELYVEPKNKSVLCDYDRCKSGKKDERGFAVGRSKYCSPNCRKRKARDKYNLANRATSLKKK